jgi:long-chain acyl-CoA synthetase
MTENNTLYSTPDLRSFWDLVKYSAEKYGESIAFSFKEGNELQQVTYREFRDEVVSLGSAFLTCGIQGKTVAILSENNYLDILSFFSLVCSGNKVVPLNRDADMDTFESIISNCNASHLIYSDECSKKANEIESLFPEIAYLTRQQIRDMVENGKAIVANGYDFGPDTLTNITDVCTIVYTSGTSGVPKGVMLTQRNIMTNVIALVSYVHYHTAAVLILPLHHMYAWTCSVLGPMIYGLEIFINTQPKRLYDDILLTNPAIVVFVPVMVRFYYNTIMQKIMNSKDAEYYMGLLNGDEILRKSYSERRDIFKEFISVLGNRIELLICGAAVLEKEIGLFFEKLGLRILVGYGLTETSPVVTINRNENFRHGSVGLVVPCNTVKINNPDGNGNGEIYIKGENVMQGYYKREAETLATFDGEWFKSGDIGRLDEDGFLYITGRIKNLIILENGENVSPEELEGKIGGISGVNEVVVYGSDNLITAEIYPNDGSEAMKKSITDNVMALNANLPPYKRIGNVTFRDCEFPKTSTKKIIRHKNN